MKKNRTKNILLVVLLIIFLFFIINIKGQRQLIKIVDKYQIVQPMKSLFNKQEKFNLKVEKEITKIEVNGEEKDIDDPKLAKIDVNRKKINDTNIKIEYTIKVTNTEDIPGSATVVETLPEFLYYNPSDSDLKWLEYDDNLIKADTGVINPGESIVLKFSVNWIGGEDSFGTQSNEVYLENIKNDKNIKEDNKEDNKDTADFILEIKTGNRSTIFVITGVVIIFIEIIITYILIKKNKR